MFYVASVRYIYSMCGFNVRPVNVWFLLSSFVCLAWVVFSDQFITKSRYYQRKIFARLLICVLVTSLLVFKGSELYFFHILILHCTVVLVYKIKNNDDLIIF